MWLTHNPLNPSLLVPDHIIKSVFPKEYPGIELCIILQRERMERQTHHQWHHLGHDQNHDCIVQGKGAKI
ncbi:ABH_G0000790.mRNA.1.CDS.1 [Saccharomyces cerevisiae]|nr:ABH_G0000790.mRNA.1.CDS.1 [Saccharomyces cerevisiae]CAI4240703.1 BCN_G0000800.mRNA.1.CDS.1 [Saccharomyces cerevisiae]CAI4241127.1 BHH_G0000820.mRNA.1.CDS.1 [Saccharomyces cerevisiae]CAI4242431.1 ATM_1a_G0000820.mRNA.1.CDS.1 [Saccharomyces cerevisiae]CAI4244359.1 BCE_3a_G0000800.mRNA.1.CDS.1 [Saccharomyces cerevisiae]